MGHRHVFKNGRLNWVSVQEHEDLTRAHSPRPGTNGPIQKRAGGWNGSLPGRHPTAGPVQAAVFPSSPGKCWQHPGEMSPHPPLVTTRTDPEGTTLSDVCHHAIAPLCGTYKP